jgi:hypothetical protein
MLNSFFLDQGIFKIESKVKVISSLKFPPAAVYFDKNLNAHEARFM